jgi:hypothetical protein
MTPAQLFHLTEKHVEINSTDDSKTDRRKKVNMLDMNRPETVANFESLSKMNVPRK